MTQRYFLPCVLLCTLLSAASLFAQKAQGTISLDPAQLPKIATVSDRFQSYNVEMVEVTGGRFWKPYDQVIASAPQPKEDANQLPGMDASLFMYRPPIDLTSPKLRKLAAGLAPSYMRVSGSWQNTTYFQDSDAPAPATPPRGFKGVLTRQEWKGVIDFSNAVNAPLITSVAVSSGTRDADGVWMAGQARRFFQYTTSAGGTIAATEFMNEPTIARVADVPKGYDAAAFARDVAVFTPMLRTTLPKAVFLGPGSVLEGTPLAQGGQGLAGDMIKTDDMLKATGSVFDALSYHFYGSVSLRCASGMQGASRTVAQALSSEWLHRTDIAYDFYAKARDKYLQSKPIWLTETGETACGGDSWASSFADTFRYLNQLGSLAQKGVQVVAHNTLAASDYALLDPSTLDPRPNYWAALLWRRLMGTTVLDAGRTSTPNLYLYAQCLREKKGGVALLAINADASASRSVQLKQAAKRYTMTAEKLESRQVLLNGKPLTLLADDALPATKGVSVAAGTVTLQPASLTFLAIEHAGNTSCR